MLPISPPAHVGHGRKRTSKHNMTNTLQQPGLESLSKSFEPAALEAHWGPEWEKRGYGVAGYRGTGAPDAAAAKRGD
ncbi:hypothetical protein JZU57_02595, partial [bacterium]|nr:hypothetical protein [bacterium]